jgi:phosphatidylglycerol:prolipoprotein diacylglycerol transferase
VIPYVENPVLQLGPVAIPAFPITVILAAWLGFEIVVRRAPATGIERFEAAKLGALTLFVGFVVSHVFAELAYHPERVRESPAVLLYFWGSMSSLGGMLGGALGAALWLWRRGSGWRRTLGFVDLLHFAAPFGWIFGRLGCALAHDHLGVASTHGLAVRFPGGPPFHGPRFDLGLLELFVHVAIAGLFAGLGRRPRPVGFYVGLFWLLYGPTRFGLDFLRIRETHYLGLTPAQYACALATAGAGLLLWALRRRSAR